MVRSAGARRRANVSSGMIATLAGGWAGAGPSWGLSGWKTTSGAVIRATPETRNGWGAAPGRGRMETVSPMRARRVAASCWSSTTPPPASEPCSRRKTWKRGRPTSHVGRLPYSRPAVEALIDRGKAGDTEVPPA